MSACPSTPKLFSHPGAPRLHPTHSTLVPFPAPCCPHGPQHPEGQALPKEPSNLQHSFSLWINNPRSAVGPGGCSMGDSHELGHGNNPPDNRNPFKLLFYPSQALKTPGPCSNMPGHTVAMTHTTDGRCFSIPCSFLYSLASSLDQVSCTPKPWGLRVTEVSESSAQFPGSFLIGSDQGGKGREGDTA